MVEASSPNQSEDIPDGKIIRYLHDDDLVIGCDRGRMRSSGDRFDILASSEDSRSEFRETSSPGILMPTF